MKLNQKSHEESEKGKTDVAPPMAKIGANSCGKVKEDSLESVVRLLQKRVEVLEADGKSSFLFQLANNVDSVVGLREAITTKQPCLKFIWISLVCAGLGATAYFMYETIEAFRDNPTLTKVQLKPHDRYEYPPFIACTPSWFDLDKAIELGLTTDGFKYSFGYLDPTFAPPLNLRDIDGGRKNFHKVVSEKFKSLADFFMHVAVRIEHQHSKDDFFNSSSPSFYVDGVDGKNVNVSRVFSPHGYVCHKFQFQPVDGTTGSLIQPERVHIKYEDKTRGIAATKNWLLYFSEGAMGRFTWPLFVPSSAKIYLRVQVQTFISINRAKHPCLEKRNGTHTASACMTECQNAFYMEQFQCQMFFMAAEEKSGESQKFCNYFDARNFTPEEEKSISSAMQTISEQAKDICYSKCIRPCHRHAYEATLQGIDSTPDMFYGEEQERLRNLNLSLTSFNILHDAVRQSGVITFTEVLSYTFVELASNVGGTFGLFVGGALMTFAQIILFLVDYFRAKLIKNDQIGDGR